MKQIPLREFQQKGSKLLKDLPLVLTQYGKPIAEVRKYTQDFEDTYKDIDESKKYAMSATGAPYKICPRHKVFNQSCGGPH